MSERACKNCSFGDQGICIWPIPPKLTQLFLALKAEPATHIDYEQVLACEQPFPVENFCGAYRPNVSFPPKPADFSDDYLISHRARFSSIRAAAHDLGISFSSYARRLRAANNPEKTL